MNSTTCNMRLLAGLLGAVALAGCDSIKSVSEEPSANLPPQTVVLKGIITGLSSVRSVTLMNNGDADAARSFIAAAPSQPNAGMVEVPFSFGSFDEGSAYSITVKDQPFGRNCVVSNGSGTLSAASPPNILINCTNTSTRYDLTVTLPANASWFTSLSEAKVRLTTEEAIYEAAVTPGQPSVFFDDVLFNATGELNPFIWTVTATSSEDGRINKCFVANASNINPTTGAITNPTGNITNPVVGNGTLAPCRFSVGGQVAYSMPAGVAVAPAMPGDGVTLGLRDISGRPVVLDGNVVPDVTVNSFTAGANTFTFTNAARSNSGSAYEVVVARHPTGMRCLVQQTTDGTANLFRQGLVNPVSLTDIRVFCRNRPAGAAILSGVYRYTSRLLVTQTLPTGSTAPNFSYTGAFALWNPFDFTVQNSASSNIMSFFDDGTFLYGTHASANQIEQGFYEYVTTSPQSLRFTIVSDSNVGTTAETHGMSYFPGRLNTTTTIAGVTLPSRNLASYARGTVTENTENGPVNLRAMAGIFGSQTPPTNGSAAPSPAEGPLAWSNPTATSPTAVPASYLWELIEPIDIANEMTGTFISQEHDRFWVWDYRTYYGTHASTVGGLLSMNDACFTMEDLHVSSGIYTRRGSATGCYPWNRPADGQFYLFTGAESIDFQVSHSTLGSVGNRTSGLSAISQVPGFIGRIPGGDTAFDGRSPSPIYFHIAPAATFFADADPQYFPNPETDPEDAPYNTGALSSWCGGEILGIRPTLHNSAIGNPVYLCRVRAN